MNKNRWFLCLAIVCLATPSVLSNARDESAATIVTPRQLEADWLRQDDLRAAPWLLLKAGVMPHVTPAEDAAGAVDGRKTGKWPFHTKNQENPWWQVDLQQDTAVDRVVLYNRCDGNAGRASHVLVLLSSDGKQFRQVYRHDGTIFGGLADNKPLVVKLGGARARYVRLQLPGKSYFHLDAVEVYRAGSDQDVALGKPATQSSVSEWSARHERPEISLAIERGLKLAADLRRAGVKVDAETDVLKQAARQFQQLPVDGHSETRRQLYLQVRRAVRAMALRNPLLDFDSIVFVKRAPGLYPHVADQEYGWWSRPGGGIFILQGFKSDNPRLRCLSQGFAPGCFEGPDLSYDGQTLLFAYCRHFPHVARMWKSDKTKLPEEAFYHVFEMRIDGSGLRQLTRGRYDDFDPRYLPSGEIVFLSTRKGQFLQCTKRNTSATTQATLPDSYVRCGGDDGRPVAVFTLHAMDRDGGGLRPLSAFESPEWTPSVACDGRILYARWDYIDRFNGRFFSLWSTNPDGTNAQLVFKNYTSPPQSVFEARAIPGSQKLIFTGTGHHAFTGGSLVLLDRTQGSEETRPMTRLTPEVVFPEAEGSPSHYYASPWPLSEAHYLVAWSDRPMAIYLPAVNDERNPVNGQGIYLYDAFGNLNLLYRDPAISSLWPIPLRARPKPPARPSTVAWDGPQEGRFMLQDVYQGLAGIPRGTIKQLRVVGVPPKTQPQMNSPSLGVSREDTGKYVLGTVPVESDGSAYFRVPSGVSVFFQALDGDGLAVQTMRSLTYVQPGQTLGCIGCHESREAVPAVGHGPLASARAPSKLKPGPAGSWPLRFDVLVQPVLDRQCVRCHSPASREARAAKLDLTPAKSYDNLLTFGDKNLHNLVYERDRSVAGDCPARKSKLRSLLTAAGGHEGVKLDAQSLRCLETWMDTYAQRLGCFSPQQEAKLREFRAQLKPMLEE